MAHGGGGHPLARVGLVSALADRGAALAAELRRQASAHREAGREQQAEAADDEAEEVEAYVKIDRQAEAAQARLERDARAVRS
jgi:hypothetical protein